VQLPLRAQLHEQVPPPRREGEAAASNRRREDGPAALLAMPVPPFRAVNPSSREAWRRSSLLDPARREKSARRRRWGVEGRGRRGEIGEGRGAPAPPRARPPVRRGARRLGARTTLEPPSLLAPSLPLLHRWSYSVAAGRDAAEGSRGVNVTARTARAAASPSARGAGRYREERE